MPSAACLGAGVRRTATAVPVNTTIFEPEVSMMKKTLAVIMCLAMILAVFAGCSGNTVAPEPASKDSSAPESVQSAGSESETAQPEVKQGGLRVAYSVGYVGNAWRSQLVSSLEEAAQDYIDDGTIASFQIVSADNDSTQQISQCNALLAEGLDALLICAVSPTTLTSVVENAKEKGTLVIISNDPAVYEGTYCVVNNAYSYSMLINRWFSKQIETGADVVYISGNPGNGTDMIRDQAVYDAAEEYGWNLIAEAPGKRNQTEAQAIMTTFLSTYSNIDGVVCQNTTFEGVKQAYDNAGVPMPVVCGDSVLSTLRIWQNMGDYDTIGVTNSPAISVASLHFAVLMLQGYELDESKLGPNPLDEAMINTVQVDPPVAVTKDGTLDAGILADYPLLTVLSLADALAKYEGMEDTYIPDEPMSREDCLATYFKVS